jgi:hypothetical protein
MILNNFKINLDKKSISYVGDKSNIYDACELYSFIMDLFDKPEYIKYDIPIVAKSADKFELINGWVIDKNSLKHIKGKIK